MLGQKGIDLTKLLGGGIKEDWECGGLLKYWGTLPWTSPLHKYLGDMSHCPIGIDALLGRVIAQIVF